MAKKSKDKSFTKEEWKLIMETLDKNPGKYGLPIRKYGSVVLGSFNVRKLGGMSTSFNVLTSGGPAFEVAITKMGLNEFYFHGFDDGGGFISFELPETNVPYSIIIDDVVPAIEVYRTGELAFCKI